MPPDYFPLRWESTGDQWWYASPIDWAAANGHYDIVRELLHLDTNLLIKLTSLRRIRRLETVWDDEEQFDDVAKCRSHVAIKLLLECETSKGHNSLIRAGYGGWLLYTAASAGDVEFVKQLLARDPLLVFGEGEYGVTDIFYAAARSKNSELFRVLLDFSVSRKCSESTREELELQTKENSVFRWEMMNRAIHAVARGGDVEMLRELLGDCSDVLVYRDGQGSTLLHTAAGRGQVEVVKHLLASYDILTSRDNQGNTALNIAAYRGYLAVAEVLITASLSSSYLTNNFGDTFLHMAVAGFRTPGFQRVDRQIELMRELLSGKFVDMQNIINVRNNDGMTVLHMAVTENLHTDLVELLMSVPSTDLNMCNAKCMTPLDLLKQQPRSTSSEILIKRLISAGGFSNCQDHMVRSAFAFHLKMQGIGRSPGTSFRIPDAEIVFYSGFEHDSEGSCDPTSTDYGTYSGEVSHFDSDAKSISFDNRKSGSINKAARHLKILLQWARRKEKKAKRAKLEEDSSLESYGIGRRLEGNPIPLRQRFSKVSSMPNNSRVVCVSTSIPSPYSKKKFAAGLMHGVIQVMPQLGIGSPSSPFSESSWSSFKSIDKERSVDVGDVYADPTCLNHSPDVENSQISSKQTSFNRRLMNKYFCFGAQGLALGGSMRSTRLQKSNRH